MNSERRQRVDRLLVAALERQYDTFVEGLQKPSLLATDVSELPSADEIGAEFEQFLREVAEVSDAAARDAVAGLPAMPAADRDPGRQFHDGLGGGRRRPSRTGLSLCQLRAASDPLSMKAGGRPQPGYRRAVGR